MREITRSVKVALKCLIAVVLVDVDLPYWTSKVEHLVAFAAIISNICTEQCMVISTSNLVGIIDVVVDACGIRNFAQDV